MRATLKTLLALARIRLSSVMVYRASFLIPFFVDSITFITQLVFLRLLTAGMRGVWSQHMLTMFVGSFMTLDGVYMTTWFFGVVSLPSLIQSGDLDLYRIRPVSTLLYVCFSKFDVGSIFIAALGVVVTMAGALGEGCLTVGTAALWVLALILMYTLMFALSLLIRTLAFRTRALSAIDQLEGSLVEYAFRLPMPAIQGIWRWVLLLALPYGLAANFPAMALAGQTTPLMWLYAAAVTAAFLALSVFAFGRGLRRYESASS